MLAFSLTKLRAKGTLVKKKINQFKACNSLKDIVACGEFKYEDIVSCLGQAKQILKLCDELSIDCIDILSDRYPRNLFDMSNPPIILFALGNIKLLSMKTIAVIGTRHSTNLGNKIASKLGEYFSKNNAICNGLVEGIDINSVQKEGVTFQNVIGVASSGLNYRLTATKKHALYLDTVLKAGGLLVSTFYPNQKEDQFSGSKASEIQAGLSDALILVQSKIGGGSKYTMKMFSKFERPIGIISYPQSQEYHSPDFDANRLIINNAQEGIGKFCDIKNIKNIKTSRILEIKGRTDYISFEKAICQGDLALF